MASLGVDVAPSTLEQLLLKHGLAATVDFLSGARYIS